MKKIVFILSFLFSTIVCFGQSKVSRSGPANTVVDQNLNAANSFIPPVFNDTNAANAVVSLDSTGKMFFGRDVNNFWVRACCPKRWVRVGNDGTLTSVSGTAGRITSTGGASPIINIDPTWEGQTSLTTLGTITTGVWNGTVIGTAFGGVADGGSTGQVLTKNSGTDYDYSWQTPSTGGGGLSGGNLGSAFRLYSPSSAGVYTVTSNATILLDSSLSTSLRIRVDTTTNVASKWFAHNQSLLDITNSVGNLADTILYRAISDFGIPTKIWAFGDSFSQYPTGLTASPDSAWLDHFSDYLDLPITNLAAGGKGVFRMISNANANINPGHTGYTASMNTGFNDFRRTDTLNSLTYRKTKNKFVNAYKSLFVTQYLSVAMDVQSPEVTKYGSWFGYSAYTVGGRLNGMSNFTLNDSLTYTFAGRTTLAIGMIGADSINEAYSRFRMVLYEVGGSAVTDTTATENNQYDGVSDGDNDNRRGPMAFFWTGLNANKQYRLKIINTQGTNVLAVDYVGHMVEVSDGYQMLWLPPAYMNGTGYNTSPAGASNWVMDEAKRLMDSLTLKIKGSYPLYVGNTNAYYSISTGLSGDNIHPNDVGHRQIYNAALAVVPSPIQLPLEGSVFHAGANIYAVLNGSAQRLNGALNAWTGMTDSLGYLIVNLSKGVGALQTVIGGGPTGDLGLKSNQNGTGFIRFGTSNYDETNNFLGINMTASSTRLDITNSGNAFYRLLALHGMSGQMGAAIDYRDVSSNPLFMVGPGGALHVMGGVVTYPAPGIHLQYVGGASYMDGYDGSNWNAMNFRGLSQTFLTNGSTSAIANTSQVWTFNKAINTGIAGTTAGGITISGSTTGTVSILPGAAAAGTFNFNLPVTAGTSGYVLTSGGGGSTAMTWTNPSTLAGSPAGGNRDIQFNNNGVFGAASSDSLEWTAGNISIKGGAKIVANSGSGTPALSSPLYVDAGTGDYAGEFRSTGDFTGFAVRSEKGDGNAVPFVQIANVTNSKTWTWILPTSGDMAFMEGGALGSDRVHIEAGGYVGIGVSNPSAVLNLMAGTTTAGTAPLKFTSGTSMTSAEAGAMEFTTDDLFFTITTGTARKRVGIVDPSGGLTSGRVTFATTNGRLTDDADMTFDGTKLSLSNTNSTLGIGSTAIAYFGIYNTPTLPAAVATKPSLYLSQGTIQEAGSGNHPTIAGMYLDYPTITSGAATNDTSATLLIAGAPIGANPAVANYSMVVREGYSMVSSLGTKIRGISSSTTLTPSDHTILVTTTGGVVTVTLPPAAAYTGIQYVIKMVTTTNSVVIDGDGSETIDGSTTQTLSSQWSSYTIQSNGSAWYIL